MAFLCDLAHFTTNAKQDKIKDVYFNFSALLYF